MATKKKKKSKRPTIVWFARGGGITKAGPFATQIEAVASMKMLTETDEEYSNMKWGASPPYRPQYRGGFPEDIFVWPEYFKED